MYQALYRKWRPRTFDEVVGQEHITATLKRQVAADRLSHAYLFTGTRGTGKTTCARILARAVNCQHPVDGNPCNECPACLGIESGGILDVVELDAASNNRVDDVRALQDEAVFSPASVKKRVYIIDEVHMLSTAAFNALLKILEEPPEHLMFILCTTEMQKVLPTIVSRCQRHSFKRLEPAAIAGRLSQVAEAEDLPLEPAAADLLARLADGGMRDALSLLDQCVGREPIDLTAVQDVMGLAGSRRTEELLEAVRKQDPDQALSLFDSLWKDGKDPTGILDELGNLMRDVMILQTAPRSGERLVSGVHSLSVLQFFAGKMSSGFLLDAMDAVRRAELGGANPRRGAEVCLARLCVPEAGNSMSALADRLSRVEMALRSGISPVAGQGEKSALPAETGKDRAKSLNTASEKKPEKDQVREEDSRPADPSARIREADIPFYTDENVPPADVSFYNDEDAPPADVSIYTDDDAPPADRIFCADEDAPLEEISLSIPADPGGSDLPQAHASAAPAWEEPPTGRLPQTGGESDSGEFWKTLLPRLQGKLPLYQYAFLMSPETEAVLEGSALTIFLSSAMAADMLSAPENLSAIREEASALRGSPVQAAVTVRQRSTSVVPDMEKLGELEKKFPNFTIS